jgi:hypothetical protein
MVEICTTNNSPRLRYAAEQFFAPLTVRWCADVKDLYAPEKAIFYQCQSNQGAVIGPSVRDWTSLDFFYTEQPNDWGNDILLRSSEIDVFEVVFYLLARVDEYLNPNLDEYGRICTDTFIQHQWSGLNCAYIDLMRNEWIARLGIEDTFRSAKELTIDVDSAYAFLHKGMKRTLGGLVKDLIKFDFRNFTERCRVLLEGQDRFDTYSYVLFQAKSHEWKARFFFLLADFGPQNIGLPFQSKGLQKLIQELDKHAAVGIHPGYHPWEEYAEATAVEVNRLKEIVARPIQESRQHFLRMQLPDTYRLLEALGIQRDYTMGMAKEVGYRAGTSRSFRWYDYQQDRMSELEIVPFWGMDSAIKRHKGWSIATAKAEIMSAMREIEGKGDWRMIWHNETLSDAREWKGWRGVFEQQFK